MTQSVFRVLALIGSLAIAAGCQSDSQKPDAQAAKEERAGSGPSANPTTGPDKAALIFSDDFSNPSSGWERQRDEDYITDYAEGEYQVKNATDHQITRGMFESREVSDGDFSVTARKISGPDDIRFGLAARYNDQGFLEASVLPDGRCNLWVAHYANYALRTKPNFKPCPAVRRGNEPNELRLVVKGARALFYVNGQKVAELNNLDQEGRAFGLFANSTSAASDVRFDNFALHEAP